MQAREAIFTSGNRLFQKELSLVRRHVQVLFVCSFLLLARDAQPVAQVEQKSSERDTPELLVEERWVQHLLLEALEQNGVQSEVVQEAYHDFHYRPGEKFPLNSAALQGVYVEEAGRYGSFVDRFQHDQLDSFLQEPRFRLEVGELLYFRTQVSEYGTNTWIYVALVVPSTNAMRPQILPLAGSIAQRVSLQSYLEQHPKITEIMRVRLSGLAELQQRADHLMNGRPEFRTLTNRVSVAAQTAPDTLVQYGSLAGWGAGAYRRENGLPPVTPEEFVDVLVQRHLQFEQTTGLRLNMHLDLIVVGGDGYVNESTPEVIEEFHRRTEELGRASSITLNIRVPTSWTHRPGQPSDMLLEFLPELFLGSRQYQGSEAIQRLRAQMLDPELAIGLTIDPELPRGVSIQETANGFTSSIHDGSVPFRALDIKRIAAAFKLLFGEDRTVGVYEMGEGSHDGLTVERSEYARGVALDWFIYAGKGDPESKVNGAISLARDSGTNRFRVRHSLVFMFYPREESLANYLRGWYQDTHSLEENMLHLLAQENDLGLVAFALQ